MYLLTLNSENREKSFKILESYGINLDTIDNSHTYVLFDLFQESNPYKNGFLDRNFVQAKNIKINSYKSQFDFPDVPFEGRLKIKNCTKLQTSSELKLRLKSIFKDRRSKVSKCRYDIQDLLNKYNSAHIYINNHFTMSNPTFVDGLEIMITDDLENKDIVIKDIISIFDLYKNDIKISFENEVKEHKVETYLNYNTFNNKTTIGLIIEGSDVENSIYDFLAKIA